MTLFCGFAESFPQAIEDGRRPVGRQMRESRFQRQPILGTGSLRDDAPNVESGLLVKTGSTGFFDTAHEVINAGEDIRLGTPGGFQAKRLDHSRLARPGIHPCRDPGNRRRLRPTTGIGQINSEGPRDCVPNRNPPAFGIVVGVASDEQGSNLAPPEFRPIAQGQQVGGEGPAFGVMLELETVRNAFMFGESRHDALVVPALAKDKVDGFELLHRISIFESIAVCITSCPKVVATIFSGLSMRRSRRR